MVANTHIHVLYVDIKVGYINKNKFMKQYIDKSVVIAEIERRIAEYKDMKIDSSYYEGMVASLEFFRDEFINTLEVKEVDLDVMQRMEECPYRQVGCTMYEGHILECKGACCWVVDYLNLKQLKAQKGE